MSNSLLGKGIKIVQRVSKGKVKLFALHKHLMISENMGKNVQRVPQCWKKKSRGHRLRLAVHGSASSYGYISTHPSGTTCKCVYSIFLAATLLRTHIEYGKETNKPCLKMRFRCCCADEPAAAAGALLTPPPHQPTAAARLNCKFPALTRLVEPLLPTKCGGCRTEWAGIS